MDVVVPMWLSQAQLDLKFKGVSRDAFGTLCEEVLIMLKTRNWDILKLVET